MELKKTLFEGCFLFSGNRFADDRGYFQTIYIQDGDYHCDFKQTSYSVSGKGVIRGLHCSPYSKFVQCLKGRLYDVVVDLREDSKTYKQWFGTWLSGEEAEHLFIPSNCAHGFYSNVDDTILLYLQGDIWKPGQDKNYHYTSFGIEWPVDPIVVSDKDKASEKSV